MFTTAEFTAFVNYWIFNNPKCLNCLFGDTTAFINWKRQAVKQSIIRHDASVSGSGYGTLARAFAVRRAKMYVAEVCGELANETEAFHA